MIVFPFPHGDRLYVCLLDYTTSEQGPGLAPFSVPGAWHKRWSIFVVICFESYLERKMNETRCSRSSITRGCLYHKPLSPLPSSLVAFIHRLISKPKRRIHVHPPRCRSVERKTGREAGESLFAGAAGPRRGPCEPWGLRGKQRSSLRPEGGAPRGFMPSAHFTAMNSASFLQKPQPRHAAFLVFFVQG